MPSILLRDIPGIKRGLKHLLKNDPVFSVQGWSLRDFDRSCSKPSFESLVRIILGQQVSVAAANTMWNRLVDHQLTKAKVLKDFSPQSLRTYGISPQKSGYILGLAQAVHLKKLDLKGLADAPDEDVLQAITALKGFGLWSAQMFMMFSLARPDLWPAGDLAIQKGMQVYHRKRVRPDLSQTQKMGQKFTPYRTAAALLTWKLSHIKPLG